MLLISGSCKYWKQLPPQSVVKSTECQVCHVSSKFLHKSEKGIFYQRRKNVIKDFYCAPKFTICLSPSLWTCQVVRSDSSLRGSANWTGWFHAASWLGGCAPPHRCSSQHWEILQDDSTKNIFFFLTKAFCFMSSFKTGFVKSSNCLYEQGQFALLLLQNEQTSTS